jgi:2-hydroxy-6-oxonona-2,4-dienedioate hydrolase
MITSQRRSGLLRRWTPVGDHTLHSVETSAAVSGRRPSVVLLHGAVVTARYFHPLLQALRRIDMTVPAAAVELPGIGDSSWGGAPRDVGGQAEVVARWLRATGRAPAILVGNSMGAQTVVELAVREPELVDGLVLLGPTVDVQARTAVAQFGKLLVDATVEPVRQVLISCTDVVRSNPVALVRYLRASLEHRIEDRMAALSVPVLLVRGELDPLVPRRWLRQLLELTPDGRIAEVRAGAHTCHFEYPERVAHLIFEVLGGVLRERDPRLQRADGRGWTSRPSPGRASLRPADPNSAT